MARKPRPSLRRARRRTGERVAALRELLATARNKLKTSAREDAWLRSLFGGVMSGRNRMALPLASDLWLREQSTLLLIDQVLAHWSARPAGRRYAFITFIDESGNTLMRRPRLNRTAFRQKVYRALHARKLDAVITLELQALTNYPQAGHGNTLMLHAHALVWSDDPAWADDPQTAYGTWALDVGHRDSWSCRFEAEPILPLIIGDTAGDIATVAAYMSKVPSNGSRSIKNPETDTRRMRSTIASYRPDDALRVMEVLSQIELNQLIFAVGRGNDIVRPWRKALLAVHKGHRRASQRDATIAEIAAGWATLRQHAGNRNHRVPFRWLSGRRRPRTIHVGHHAAASAEAEWDRTRRQKELHAALAENRRLEEL